MECAGVLDVVRKAMEGQVGLEAALAIAAAALPKPFDVVVLVSQPVGISVPIAYFSEAVSRFLAW